jgi:glycosyltransferase involved in cell wall biosynthesis
VRLLQVCNVGRIVGGTAACAWSIVRAFPDVEHHVAFPPSITDETRDAFTGTSLHLCPEVTNGLVRDLRCDSVILHNISASRAERITAAWTLQYVHSKGTRAPADCVRYCSRWLARQCLGECATDKDVLYQAVPRPIGEQRSADASRDLVVGRICTPTAAKWPSALIDFYAQLAPRHPRVRWEFVGCPAELQQPLGRACGQKAAFHPAGWTARSHLTRWDALLYHHPTLTESFGRTVAEAMRAGCIPIVDARGGFQEQITSETGWLCRTNRDFSDALERLADASVRERMAACARDRADLAFSMSAIRQRLRNLWRQAA